VAATAAGIMAPQCGLAPGFVGIVGADLAARFERVRSLRLRVGALPQHPTVRLGYAFNWSPEGVVNEYLNDCEVIEDGTRKMVSAMEWVETVHVGGTTLEAFTTSGGLGTMGYGLPAALGVQIAHPDALVIDIAGEASVQMTMQEMSTAIQYDLPIKIFILNNEWMGMVRQWQQLLQGERYSHSYSSSLPDFVKLAEAYGGVGFRAEHPDELDEKILEMIEVKRPVLFDCRVTKEENCFPMIPSGEAHNNMILGDLGEQTVSAAGKMLV